MTKNSATANDDVGSEKSGATIVFKMLWELLGESLRPEWGRLALACLFIVISTFGSLAGPIIIKEIIDKALPGKDIGLLLYYGALLVLTNIIAFIFWAIYSKFAIGASERIFLQFRQQLIKGIMKKRLDFFSKHLSGDILTRVASDLVFISSFFQETVLRSFAFTVFSLVLITGLIIWNWILGIVFLITLPLLLIYARKTYKPISTAFRHAKEKLAGQNETLLDILTGIREIRFFQQQERTAQRFYDASKGYTDHNIHSLTLSEWSSSGLDFLAVLVRVLPFLIGGLLICQGNSTITVGMLVAYFVIFFRLASQIFFIFQGIITSAQALPALQRIKEIMDFPEEQEPAGLTLADMPETTEIEFCHVSFAYPHSKAIFTDLNLYIAPGAKIAFMGPSGSGKSTLAQLLTRFLQPTGGKILFGGKDIRSYPMAFYLSFFAYVSQEMHLFRETFRENIAMGWYGVPMDRIREVASLVRIKEAIEALPAQYETIFGHDGTNLSGGQKQRLALARALIRDPEILVLDEFTSGLDQDVEKEILDDLFRIFANQTIICITHSAAVAARFERVFRIPAAPPNQP
jgi:ATP-binding cassette, subfamily B, bacterial